MNLTLMLLLSTALKWILFPLFRGYFRIYPHFQTPLNDIRELKEMFYMYETKGEFYPNTLQIGQSELLLYSLYHLQHYVSLAWVLAAGDIALTCARLYVVR